jgi:uncharacterized protein
LPTYVGVGAEENPQTHRRERQDRLTSHADRRLSSGQPTDVLWFGHDLDMDRVAARLLLTKLHAAQNAMYAGGDIQPVRALLTEDIEWHVPGVNAISGDYRGVDAVVGYFLRRRALATNTFRMHPGELLLGDEDHMAVLTDGSAVVNGLEHCWSTLGLYRAQDARIAACWLLPLDQAAFDRAWASTR